MKAVKCLKASSVGLENLERGSAVARDSTTSPAEGKEDQRS
jgi:hypothetical protein